MTARPISHHAEWLGLVEISGPFLSLPVLERVFPQGLDMLDSDHATKLRLAREEWAEENERPEPDREIHDAWIRYVLNETLDYIPDVLVEPGAVPPELTTVVEEHGETLCPDYIVARPADHRPRLLVQVYVPSQDLDSQVEGSKWAASPTERMTHLCRAVDVRLGLVTNGERWTLVDAPQGETPAYVSWFASLWAQEPLTLRAFRSLLGTRRFFGVDEDETLEAMLTESLSYQAEVTEQLGAQVRRAVEVLVQALDRADADTGRTLLQDVSEGELYEAALTVMMRLVFMFFAEENDLLPLRDDLYQQHYAASTLRAQLREDADRVGIEVLERRQDAWPRLLASFRGIYGGIEHDALRLPPYGGSLFDPDRFPFLEGRLTGTTWRETDAQPLPLDNRTTLHLLDALQVLQMRGRRGTEARKLSFRSLDIEQIGHVYETLLDHEVARAEAPGVGLVGTKGAEPEVGLDELDEHRERGEEALLEFLADQTKKTRSSLDKAIGKEPDSAWIEQLRAACGDDDQLLERVLPYQALIRTDPWGEPIVIRAGSVFVTSGAERRSTGTYYTPRALTEEVVTHALEPLAYQGPAEGTPRLEWRLKTPAEILELKICDLAMGSGAFLVQVVRWLSDRLIEAWDAAETTTDRIMVDGTAAGENLAEAIPSHPDDRHALARRLVADRCVYGVDVNPLAVEMAKLSLWLVTLAKNQPFSFLDHALKCGDSLLGVHDLDQIRGFHMDPARGRDLHATLFDPGPHIEKVVDEALRLRRELESFTVRDVHDAEQKAELNRRADTALDRARLLGDLVVGAAISTAGQKSSALDDRLTAVVDRIPSMLEAPGTEVDELLRADAMIMLNAGKPALTRDRRTLHWPLEFPEVFIRRNSGFDAFVGNPPFLGDSRLTGVFGTEYREYVVNWIAQLRGRADLVAFFFLRAFALIQGNGTFGLLATNTIGEGDTREVALDQIGQRGTIYRAVKSRRWPGSASLHVAVVWATQHSFSPSFVLDGTEVNGISPSLLRVRRVSGRPFRLEFDEKRSFKGSDLGGNGFILERAEAADLLSRDDKNAQVIRPYIGGEDVNRRYDFSASRWVITFYDWPLERAMNYPEVFRVLEERVKPYRETVNRETRRKLWWRHGDWRPALYRRAAGMSRVVALTITSDTLIPVFLPTDMVYSTGLAIFTYEDDFYLGHLTSSFHQVWAQEYASTLETRIRYTPSDCFETFPQPPFSAQVAAVAKSLDTCRREVMLNTTLGLTKLYNRVHDPDNAEVDVLTLRDFHAQLDRAVADAYSWDDLHLQHGFYESPQGVRFTIGPEARSEVLDRLLEVNHSRHAAGGQPSLL